jgi:hypothetical protein
MAFSRPSAWEQQGCERCRDAWSSLAKDVDRTVVSAVKRGDTGTLYKCRACGSLWEEWMGGKGPAAITREEAGKRYGYLEVEAEIGWPALIARYSRLRDELATAMQGLPTAPPRRSATPQQIADAERQIGVRLHRKHRDFLLHADGWPHFSGPISLLGTKDYLGSPLYERALANLDSLRQPVGYLSRNKTLFPIGVSEATLDTLCMPVAGGTAKAPVIWYNNVEPDDFADFEMFFVTLLQRMPQKIAHYKATRGG